MKKTPATSRIEDVRAATRLIGATAEARLRWVTEFARDELPEHPGARAAASDCLVALAWPAPPWTAAPAPLAQKTIETLHAELRVIFLDLVTRTEGSTDFPVSAPVQIKRLTVAHQKPAKWASARPITPDNPRVAILLAVRDLVLMGGDRLLGCLDCKKAFVGRKRQEYCTDVCAQRARNQRNAPRRRKGAAR